MARTLDRLRHTPLVDLLRGEISGRLDWRSRIISADVPAEVKELVSAIVRDTGLSRTEKSDLAAEMLAHFEDGIADGSSISELLEEFGDPREVTPAFRSSIIRKNPLPRLLHWCCLASALLIGVYFASAIYYSRRSPTAMVDYVSEMNKAVVRSSPSERAWPIYRSVLVALRGKQWDPLVSENPDGKHWSEMVRWIDDHESSIQLIRDATSRPEMGFVLGTDSSSFGRESSDETKASVDAVVAQIPMHQLEDVRVIATLIELDTKRAREQGDGERVEADIAALTKFAAQEHGSVQPVIGEVCSVGVLEDAYDQLDQTLNQTPKLLTDAALARLAQLLSVPQNASDVINFTGERLLFDDVLQHTYTDDGNGDGHLSKSGWDFLRENFPESPNLPQEMFAGPYANAMLHPAAVVMMGSRKELHDKYQQWMDLNDVLIRGPLRDAQFDAPYEELRSLSSSIDTRWQYAVMLAVAPSLDHDAEIAERTMGDRDGILVGIAIERYYRRNQHYPEALDQLMPDLLPAIPADRITGEPVKYRLIDGKPTVYSVGVDRTDDGGRLPMRNAIPDPSAAARWGKFAPLISGDWVLYPKPRIPNDALVAE